MITSTRPHYESDAVDLARLFFSIRQEPRSWEDFIVLHARYAGNEDQNIPAAWMALCAPFIKSFKCHVYRPDRSQIYFMARVQDRKHLDQIASTIDTFNQDRPYACIQTRYVLRRHMAAFLAHLESAWITPANIEPAPKTIQVRRTSESAGAQARPKVLLVEDEQVTRWMMRRILRDKCELATASCAHQLYALFKSWKPDLIFLDINLPDNTGGALLSWIIRQDPHAYVVMCSSEDNVDTMTSMIERGARGFIAKPFDRDIVGHYLNAYQSTRGECLS